MKFSIVTISFNQKQFLRQCIESVLSQESEELEYIVVDPGSTDGSREIIDEYENRLIKIYEPDDGPADGLNQGFSKATGQIGGFINSDDYFLPGAFKAIEQHYQTYGLNHFITGHGFQIRGNQWWPMVPVRLSMMRLRMMRLPIFQQGTFFPVSFFREAGGFNPGNKTCWDGELFLRFIQLGFAHKILNKKLSVFRIHESSISGMGSNAEQYRKDRSRIYTSLFGGHESSFSSRRRTVFGKILRIRYSLRLIDLLKAYAQKIN